MISVVIPTYRRNELLGRCLDQLAPVTQALGSQEYEVIVTDDAAGHNAEKLVRERYPWARWTAGPALGPAANRNHGARQAKGDWIAFTDDDCVPSKQWLAAFLAATEDGFDVYEGKTTCNAGIHSPMYEAPINLVGGHLWSCNMMIRTSLFQQSGGFNERFPSPACEDVEFHGRLTQMNARMRFVPEAVVDHPPRRRRIGAAAVHQWESRVLLDAIQGTSIPEWLPLHVLKVRIAQLRDFPISLACIPYLSSTAVEVVGVALNHKKWQRKYDANGTYAINVITADSRPARAGK